MPAGAMIFRLLLLGFAVALTSLPARAENWDRFRGPNGTGVANDKNIPIQFGLKNNLRWMAPIDGTGNSSPVIWGNRIFLQNASADFNQQDWGISKAIDGKPETAWGIYPEVGKSHHRSPRGT